MEVQLKIRPGAKLHGTLPFFCFFVCKFARIRRTKWRSRDTPASSCRLKFTSGIRYVQRRFLFFFFFAAVPTRDRCDLQEEPKKVRFDYDLFLHLEGHPPVNHLRCEKLTFNNPTEEFRRKLLRAGGVGGGLSPFFFFLSSTPSVPDSLHFYLPAHRRPLSSAGFYDPRAKCSVFTLPARLFGAFKGKATTFPLGNRRAIEKPHLTSPHLARTQCRPKMTWSMRNGANNFSRLFFKTATGSAQTHLGGLKGKISIVQK